MQAQPSGDQAIEIQGEEAATAEGTPALRKALSFVWGGLWGIKGKKPCVGGTSWRAGADS